MTTRSAFANAEHDACWREPGRAGGRGKTVFSGEGGGGRGEGAVFEKGCEGWVGVVGGRNVRTYPRNGCVTDE